MSHVVCWNVSHITSLEICLHSYYSRMCFPGARYLSLNWTTKLTVAFMSWRIPHSSVLENWLVRNYHGVLLVPSALSAFQTLKLTSLEPILKVGCKFWNLLFAHFKICETFMI